MKDLTIYKASAGSGKTYNLVREYITLLFGNKFNYRHILAVTFTNKATSEMKGKVIKELFLLSKVDDESLRGEKSEHRKFLSEAFPELNEQEISARAYAILSLILNNYSHFFISTIDKFFQYVLKSFSKELGIMSNYALQLDNDVILDEAVEQLFSRLEEPEQGALLKWLTSYAESRVEEGSKYDITIAITSLGRELFKENFKTERLELFEVLEDKKAMATISGGIKKEISELERQFVDFGEEGLRKIRSFALEVSDFKQGSRSGMSVFNKLTERKLDEKLISSYTLKMVEDDDQWATNKSPRYSIICEARDHSLKAFLIGFMQFYNDNYERLQSLRAIFKNLFSLGIFIDLQQSIIDYTKAHNMLLLSDSNDLLNSIIGDNDTPFIYEKVGNKFHHFMIDEFQDTSSLQWENFKPLIDNSLAAGNANLLVGDVKQSIYRWRNSDWKLLAGNLEKEYRNEQINKVVLKQNWRSSEYIVKFNNLMFKYAPVCLQDGFNDEFPAADEAWKSLITKAYDDQLQEVTHKDGYGYVWFKNFGKTRELEAETVYSKTIEIIEDAQARGYSAGDITILVRTNREGAGFIKHLLLYKQGSNAKKHVCYNVLSSDSLVLGASDTLRFIVNVLKYEIRPENQLVASELNFFYKNLEAEFPHTFNAFESGKVVLSPEILNHIKTIRRLALNDKVLSTIQFFKLDSDPEQLIFIEAFKDLLNDFIKRNASDVYGFINHWEAFKTKVSVQPPKTGEAIQVMTIHKAKGLEFPIVIIPFASWSMGFGSKQNTVWCKVPESMNLKLPIVPVNLSMSLKETFFKETLMEELLMSYVDNLNLLYVALTRAKTELYLMGSEKSKNATELIVKCFELSEGVDGFKIDDETGVLSYGEPKQKKPGGLATPAFEELQLKPGANSEGTTLSIRQHAPGVFNASADNVMEKAHVGTLLHEAFCKSNTFSDVVMNLERQVREGKLAHSDRVVLEPLIKSKFETPLVKSWFSGKNKSINEITICYRSKDEKAYPSERRPDKIILLEDAVHVVDYKFGESEDAHHLRQVASYVNLLQEMGFENVMGFLWYVKLDKITRVD